MAQVANNFGLSKNESDDDADLGTPTHHDRSGRANVFEKKLGNGQSKITHVFWLPQ